MNSLEKLREDWNSHADHTLPISAEVFSGFLASLSGWQTFINSQKIASTMDESIGQMTYL